MESPNWIEIYQHLLVAPVLQYSNDDVLCSKVVQGASGCVTHAVESPTPNKLLIILISL